VLSIQDQLEQHVDERVQLEVFTYYGPNRTSNAKQLAEKDVVLTTYQTLAADGRVVYTTPLLLHLLSFDMLHNRLGTPSVAQ